MKRYRTVKASADSAAAMEEPALDRLNEAVSMLHNIHINDRYFGSAESKLFPVRDENDEIQWAVLARDLKEEDDGSDRIHPSWKTEVIL